MRSLVAVISLVFLAACSGSSSSGSGGGTGGGGGTQSDAGPETNDGGITADGGYNFLSSCSNATNPTPDHDQVLALSRIYGSWHFSKHLENSVEQGITPCDETISYKFGATYAQATEALKHAWCVIATGGFDPVVGGNIYTVAAPSGSCTQLVCSAMGLVWNTKTSGRIFAIDASGKPSGAPLFTFSIRGAVTGNFELLMSGAVMTRGDILSRVGGDPTCTP